MHWSCFIGALLGGLITGAVAFRVGFRMGIIRRTLDEARARRQ